MSHFRHFVLGGLALFAFSVPLFSSALTYGVPNDDESSGTALTSALHCPSLTTTLYRGSRDASTGGQVTDLQEFLTDYLNLDDDIVTGYFGPKTEKYVKQFQSQKGIEQVGWAGKLTRAAVLKACSDTSASTPTSTPLPTSPTVILPTEGMTAYDFLVQDVCLDAYGNVLAKDPRDASCAGKRNLKPGEKLSYHKYDQRGTDTNPEAAKGYQRSDSFPSVTGSYVIQTFDFGVGGGAFGVKDSNDGFNLYEIDGQYASALATQDGGTSWVQYFVSPRCSDNTSAPTGLNDSWILFPSYPSVGVTGSTIAKLMGSQYSAGCPSSFDQSYTAWELPSSPLTYTNNASLQTLISYHYASPTINASDHLEKFFFTREYGATRWERWERPNTQYHTDEKARAAVVTNGKRCNGPGETTDSAGTWYRVDCRDWTNINVISDSNNWYRPGDWNVPALTSSGALTTSVAPQSTPTPAPVPTPVGTPDLTLTATAPISATAGVPFSMTATVNNTGTGATASSFTNFWRLCDLGCATFNQYGSDSTPALSSGSSRSISFSYTLNTPGTYYYTLCADLPASVTESNEDNNCSVGNQINVSAAPVQPTASFKTYQATALQHNFGRADGDGWSAATALDSAGTMIYGPYATDWSGSSAEATFRMMVDNNSADNLRVVTVDIYDATTAQILAIQDINRKSFTGTFNYQDFTISASLAGRAGHAIETRVYWHDVSYVRVNQVSVRIAP